MIDTELILAITRKNFSNYFANRLGFFLALAPAVAPFIAYACTVFGGQTQIDITNPTTLLFAQLLLASAIVCPLWRDEHRIRRSDSDVLYLTNPVDTVIGKFLAALKLYSIGVLLFFTSCASIQLVSSSKTINQADVLFFVSQWTAGVILLAFALPGACLSGKSKTAFFFSVSFGCLPLAADAMSIGIASLCEQIHIPGIADTLQAFVSRFQLARLTDFTRSSPAPQELLFLAILVGVPLCLTTRSLRFLRSSETTTKSEYIQRGVRTLGVLLIGLALVALFSNPTTAESDMQRTADASETHAILEALRGSELQILAFVSQDLPAERLRQRDELIEFLRELKEHEENIDVNVINVSTENDTIKVARGLGLVPSATKSLNGPATEYFLGVLFNTPTRSTPVSIANSNQPTRQQLIAAIRVFTGKTSRQVGVLQSN